MKKHLILSIPSEDAALEAVQKALSTVKEVKKVVVFGSRVRGDFHGESDLDLLIVLTGLEVKDRVIKILHDIELDYEVPISPLVLTEKEYKKNKELKSRFIENIETQGVLLYDTDKERKT